MGPPESPGEDNSIGLPRCPQHLALLLTFAGVVPALLPAGADEYVRYVLDVARGSVHGLAYGVVDHGDGNLLQHTGQGSILIEPAPAGDEGGLANEVLIVVGNANGNDVRLEDDGLVEPAKERSRKL